MALSRYAGASLGVWVCCFFVTPAVVKNQAPESLVEWRKPDARGWSCATCHSPDGIELAAFDFSKQDIVRRGLAHLNPLESRDIAQRILTLRKDWNGTAFDPLVDRPLQPGGRVLPGNTPAERDDAFLFSLQKLLPELFAGPVSSIEQAKALEAKVLRLDPRSIQVGITLDRLSEDNFHGPEHATIANWIPDVGLPEISTTTKIQDRYLANPTVDNLRVLDRLVKGIKVKTSVEQLAQAKYRSLLLLQHAFRKHPSSTVSLTNVALIGDGNPFWDVAEVGHQEQFAVPGSLALPPDIAKRKLGGPSITKQIEDLRLPWYWLGWTLDPSLNRSGLKLETVNGDYFCQFLWQDGPYPSHMAFMLMKKLIERAAHKQNFPGSLKQHYEIQYSYFIDQRRLLSSEPTLHLGRFRGYVGNIFRLSLLLLSDDLSRTGGVLRPESQISQISEIKQYFKYAHFRHSDLTLCDSVVAQIHKATVDGR